MVKSMIAQLDIGKDINGDSEDKEIEDEEQNTIMDE